MKTNVTIKFHGFRGAGKTTLLKRVKTSLSAYPELTVSEGSELANPLGVIEVLDVEIDKKFSEPQHSSDAESDQTPAPE